jgi:hypothetical protein
VNTLVANATSEVTGCELDDPEALNETALNNPASKNVMT